MLIDIFNKKRLEVGLCYPKNYQEHYIRIFIKDEAKVCENIFNIINSLMHVNMLLASYVKSINHKWEKTMNHLQQRDFIHHKSNITLSKCRYPYHKIQEKEII